MDHLGRHLVHVLLIVSAVLVLQLADVELSTVALLALLALCLVLFEGGLWLIHRREAVRADATR